MFGQQQYYADKPSLMAQWLCHLPMGSLVLSSPLGTGFNPEPHGAISHSSQCSTTGVTKVVVCVILSVG